MDNMERRIVRSNPIFQMNFVMTHHQPVNEVVLENHRIKQIQEVGFRNFVWAWMMPYDMEMYMNSANSLLGQFCGKHTHLFLNWRGS